MAKEPKASTTTAPLTPPTIQTYRSEIELGATYREILTGFTGTAVYVSFNLTGCERVAIDRMEGNDLKAYEFDAARLVKVADPTPEALALQNKTQAPEYHGGPTTRARHV